MQNPLESAVLVVWGRKSSLYKIFLGGLITTLTPSGPIICLWLWHSVSTFFHGHTYIYLSNYMCLKHRMCTYITAIYKHIPIVTYTQIIFWRSGLCHWGGLLYGYLVIICKVVKGLVSWAKQNSWWYMIKCGYFLYEAQMTFKIFFEKTYYIFSFSYFFISSFLIYLNKNTSNWQQK